MARASQGLRTIRAAVMCGAHQPMTVKTLHIDAPRDEEVLVRIVASGICRTDIDMWEAGGIEPAILGHEGAGIVEETGRAVKTVKPGDHVVLSYQSCGRCTACHAGHPTDCEHFWDLNFGFQRLDGSSAYTAAHVRGHFFGQSSFATHVLATERNIVKVSRSLPLEVLAPLGCGLQTGAGTVMNSFRVRAGQSLAVFGTGTVGLAAIMAARIVGADPIIGIDIRPKRLALARELGATHVIDSRRTDVAKRIERICAKLNFTIDTTGDPALIAAAQSSLAPGGRLAVLAGGTDRELPENRKILAIIQGDSIPQRFIPQLIRLWRDGKFPFDRLIRFYPFEDINRAIADVENGRTIKAVLRMN